MILIGFLFHPRPECRMPKRIKADKASPLNMFRRKEATESRKRKQRRELLTTIGVTEFFVEGSIQINRRTCKGLECRLCLESCPTNALYWNSGEVGIVRELCVYCGACVLSCIVDDCIRIERKRASGQIERFSNSKDFMKLQHEINGAKRFVKIDEIKERLPKTTDLVGQHESGVHKKRTS
jgi:Fe-S-cluster-containing hydrogenase component 2